MFENILEQDRAIHALRDDIAHSTLPQAILIHGPRYAGKFSAALELARVISCKVADAPWNCSCASCSQQRHMLSPYILMGGRRYFMQEIKGSGLALLQEDRDASRFLLIRSVRKLVRRFDPVLWEGDSKQAKAMKVAEKVEDLLEAFMPANGAPFPGQAALDALYAACEDAVDLLPHDGITSAMVRHMTFWAHTADSAQPKFVIIESVENLNEGARNSLLKTLEEPPPHVYFILIARYRQAVMQTILSRVREYTFSERGAGEQAVLQRIFRQGEATWPSLHDFFRAADKERDAVLGTITNALCAAILDKTGLSMLAPRVPVPELWKLAEMASPVKDRLEDLCRDMLAILRAGIRKLDEIEGGGPPWAADRLASLIAVTERTARQALSYNVSVAVFIEMVYARSGERQCGALSKGR